jgi:hypothetical protein
MLTSGSIGSVWNTISEAIAPALYDLQDMKIDLLGSPVALLRIHREATVDIDGLANESYTSEVVSNCIIHYPGGIVTLFDGTDDQISDTSSIDLSEILPIEVYVKFHGVDSSHVVNIEREDILVDVKFSEHNNKIPILLKVNYRASGQFRAQHLATKKYECTLLRGVVQDEIKTIIDAYIASV